MEGPIVWPRKTRELRNHHLDSRIWNHLKFRNSDVVIASYPKSGTTWVQQIVGQLLTSGAKIPINWISPWMDARITPRITLAAVEAQKHRRILKSHLPLDALTFSPSAKYLYVARDGRDVVWSMHHNHLNAAELHRLLNDAPDRVGPPIEPPDPDVRSYFRRWLDEDGFPFWSYWEHIRSWWQARAVPNVRLLHFNDLQRDLEGELRRIATFLGREIPAGRWPRIVEHCGFQYMSEHAEDVAPPGADTLLQGGSRGFFHKGQNGRWRDVLTETDVADYERTAVEQLGEECATWLAGGWGRSSS